MIKRFISEKLVAFSILACIIFTLTPIGIFLYYFYGRSVPNEISKWGALGDYLGGITSAIFGLLSVVLLYYTFRDQIKNSQRQRFENKYYELIKLHRVNVDELVLSDEKGKKIFVMLLREFREILVIVKQVSIQYQKTIKREEIIDLAYLVLFYGTGPNSTRVLINAFPDSTNDFIKGLAVSLSRQKRKVKLNRKFAFTPFEGHQSRLGHYYRHLYQTITFVDTQEILSNDEKIDYIKTVRAQLSNHEQALLFFNSISRIGRNWRKENLITKYSLIKNLPKSFVDEVEEIDVKSVYPSLVFEWEEFLKDS